MTSSAFPFLDGRSALDGPVVRPRRRTPHSGPAARKVRPRFRLSSVDWADTVARHVRR